MTKQGEQTPSNFNARADNAARALRGNLRRAGAEMPETAPVEVGEDGKPPAPQPPEGSYMRQAIELSKRQQQLPQDQPIGDQPPAGTPEQALDGSPAPKLPPPNPPPQGQNGEAISPRAEQRIQQLVEQLRQKDVELQAALDVGKKSSETLTQFEQRLTALQQQHDQMVQANLDHLDPETRMQVMQDARMSQKLDEWGSQFRSELMRTFGKPLNDLQTQAARNQMQDLADKYPAFDYVIHGPLIDHFRGKNPHCSIEQAFRAVCEPEELVTRETAARAPAAPIIVPPGSGELAAARYAPGTGQQAQPRQQAQDELVEESRRLQKLLASDDPNERQQGMQQQLGHLARRLGR